MSNVPKRQRWNFGYNPEDFEEYSLADLVQYYIGLMFNRTLMMFEWKNLPDNMTSFDMEKFTQLRGKTIFLKDKADGNRFYILDGSPWNNISWNYEPTQAIVVNPSLNGLKNEYTLGKDCVLVRNDYLMMGLYPIFEKNSIDMANTDISIRFANFNTRLKSIFTSDDDNTKDSINTLIEKVWKGEKPVAVVTNDLYKKSVEGISYSNTQNNDIKNLMELKQYQLAQFYIELGINANYNMKRESVSADEFRMNDDALMPLIDQMLECRKMACKQINELFGLNIDVELNSAWLKIAKEVVNEVKQEEAEVKKTEAEAKATEEASDAVDEEIKDEEGDTSGTEEDKSNS